MSDGLTGRKPTLHQWEVIPRSGSNRPGHQARGLVGILASLFEKIDRFVGTVPMMLDQLFNSSPEVVNETAVTWQTDIHFERRDLLETRQE